LSGGTYSANFPTASPIQAALSGPTDGFVTKFNAAGSSLLYSTYLGGNGDDTALDIAVDAEGQAYITGATASTNFPTASPFQATYGGGGKDAFLTKINATGSSLLYSTYLGGNGSDEGHGIAVDVADQVYMTGETQSTNFPTASPVQATLGGLADAFVTNVNAAGSSLLYSTYLGGNGYDQGYGIAVVVTGQAYVTGHTGSTNFPTASPFQATLADDNDAFVSKITSSTSPVCSNALAHPASLWSPNHQFVPITILGVTDPENDPVTLTVLGVRQDELVLTPGRDTTSPDAVIQAGAASLRAERLDTGNGRVYQISFRADDGKGSPCTGTVAVSVPHSMKKGSIAVDDGPVYDSTIP